MLAATFLIPPALWLAAQLPVPNIPFVQRTPGYIGLVPLLIFVKGWMELVSGVRCMELIRKGDDPRDGWREFSTWLFLIASLILVVAANFVLSVMWTKLLELPEGK